MLKRANTESENLIKELSIFLCELRKYEGDSCLEQSLVPTTKENWSDGHSFDQDPVAKRDLLNRVATLASGARIITLRAQHAVETL